MSDFFKNKTPDFKRLLKYGFTEKPEFFEFFRDILDGEFVVFVKIFKDGRIKTETIEKISKEPYTLHLVEGISGTFVGKVKEEYEKVLSDVVENCFNTDIFKSKITKQVIKYITQKYKDNPEYLWEKFPENAIFRRNDNKKWYAAILTVQRDRLGFDSDESVEVINLKVSKDEMPNLIKQKNIYPGWHMNKKSWISIILDGSIDIKEIYKYIDNSYLLVKK